MPFIGRGAAIPTRCQTVTPGCLNYFYSAGILMLWFPRLGYQNPGSVLNMLPVITQCGSMKSGETRAESYVQPQSSMSALCLFTDWRGNSTPRGSATAHKTSRGSKTWVHAVLWDLQMLPFSAQKSRTPFAFCSIDCETVAYFLDSSSSSSSFFYIKLIIYLYQICCHCNLYTFWFCWDLIILWTCLNGHESHSHWT